MRHATILAGLRNFLQTQIDAPAAPIELVLEPDPFVQIHRQRAMHAIASLARVSFPLSPRLKVISAGTVLKDLGLLSAVIKTGRTE